MGVLILKCRFFKSVCSYDVVLVVLVRVWYFVLDDDRIIIGCFFKYYVIGDFFNLNMKLVVDLKIEGDV